MKKIGIRDGIIFRAEDGLLFDTERGKMIELNESAIEIIGHVEKKKTKEEIIYALELVYPDSDRKELEEYLELFLKELVERNLVVYED